ncbi:MAG: hypothetical protein U1F33_04735 [Alphaproteobacteria bacterium]
MSSAAALAQHAKPTQPTGATPLVLPNSGPVGVSDPSITVGPDGRTWLAYTMMVPAAPVVGLETRLAYLAPDGQAWHDMGLINKTAGAEATRSSSAHETPRLLFDPYGASGEQWLLFWYHYKRSGEKPEFDRGWVALRTAPDPAPEKWSAERKLFVGSRYNRDEDSVIGPPEVDVHTLHPDLADCALPGEVGALATKDALYVSLYCASKDPAKARVVLLRRPRAQPRWQYIGTLFDGADAKALGYRSFTATELAEQGGKRYLLLSPEKNFIYQGCAAFEIADLDHASLVRQQGRPAIKVRIEAKQGSFRGACTYDGHSSLGLLYAEYFATPPISRIFASRVRLPD